MALWNLTADEFRSQPDFDAKYYELLGIWREAKEELAAIKEKELASRVLLAALTFPNPKEGAQSHLFGTGKKAPKLTLTHVINRTLDPAAVGACLDDMRKAGFTEDADEVVQFKPELKVGPYKKLGDNVKGLLAPAVTSSPGTPQLKYVEPAAE